MSNIDKTIKYLKDYVPPKFEVESLDLVVELDETKTHVFAKLSIIAEDEYEPLILNGENLALLSLTLNGKKLTPDQYSVTDKLLTITKVPKKFILESMVEINPAENTALTGLYLAGKNFCTQCEAEGFRRITYYFDRPDVLTKYSCKIIADKNKYPILLSNGNPIEKGDLANNKHYVLWQDPFKKPCYLFALVAGDLEYIEDSFTTMSARQVKLQLYVEKGNQAQAIFAMSAIKEAMRWDEQVFNREYDLDIFMVVAVHDFNMGAMENKGLNIFNSKYILASKETATDEDYDAIAEVIGHEYFHNWSGNRVTCRDWFQLSLKEGLTIFRDQEFAADITSRDVKRIKDARNLRTFQYPEDAGPMSHPVQPDSYMEIDNFYTHTVYEKGSEVIRMIRTLIGDKAFHQGMELYFNTNDGKAVTIEEFVKAMEQASGKDLQQFRLWYKQAGTPVISIETKIDLNSKAFIITTEQKIPQTAGQGVKKPMHIPLAIGLYDKTGKHIKTQENQLLELKQTKDQFIFKGITEKPTISLLNNFSAPIEINYNFTEKELCFLMRHDENAFSRCEAGQIYFKNIFMNSEKKELPEEYLTAFTACLLDEKSDPEFIAELLRLPTEKYLLNLSKPIEVLTLHEKYKFYEKHIAEKLYDHFLRVYHKNHSRQGNDRASIAARKLKNVCLYYLVKANTAEALELSYQQYIHSTTMTDRLAAFHAILLTENQFQQKCITDFYQQFNNFTLVLDKWFSSQAVIDLPETLNNVKQLMKHPEFNLKNPNKVRALVGAFSMYNIGQFHRTDGQGYEFLADVVLSLNQINPQIAARLLTPLIFWKDYTAPYQNLMLQQLQRIHAEPKLSADVYEIVEKSLK